MDIAIHTLAQLRGWDAFNAASVQGTVFSSSEWLAAMAQRTGADLAILAASEDDALLAAIPLLKRKKLWYNIATTTALSPYNGIIASAGLTKEAHMHEALGQLLKTGIAEFGFISISVHPSFKDMRPFMWEGWQVEKLYTYWVDITSEEGYWNNFSQSLRRKVRRAQDDGITIRENPDPGLMVSQYMYSYRRHGIREPIPLDDLRGWIDQLLTIPLATMFTAFSASGTPLASRMVIPDAPFVYDWLAGSSEEGDAQSANHALVAGIMQQYAQRGYSTFDFRGANTPGVINFKRSFGGLLVSYSRAVYRNSALLSLGEKLSAALTGKWRGL